MEEDFCIIETYNPHDETINFGSRPVSEGNKLYESVTLCSMNIKNFDHEYSTVNNLIVGDKLFLAIGKILIIFDNRNCSSLNYIKQFDDIIDSFAVKNNYVLLCLRNGSTILLNFKTTYEVLKTLNIDSNLLLLNKHFIGCFVDNSENENATFLLITDRGIIYRIIFDVSDETVECKVETVADFKKRVEVAALCNDKLLLNGSDLIVYDLIDCDCSVIPALDLKCVFINTKNFIGLLKNGTLVNICTDSLMIFPIMATDLYKDLFFFKQQGEEFIFVITKDTSGECKAKLINMSAISEPLYEIKVPDKVYLFNTDDIYEEQLCLSYIQEDEWRVQKFWENEPEKRLERLLKKELFDEAEEFAKSFGLKFELILKARTKYLLDKNVCNEEDTIKLIELLDSIDDVHFKLDSCLNVTCDTYEDTRKILLYGTGLNDKKSVPSDMFTKINETLYRFDTFTLLNKDCQLDFDHNEWNHFCGVDLWKSLCQNLRRCNDIESCIILFCRLEMTNLLNLTLDDVNDILNILEKMPQKKFISFLHQFIPKILLYFPASLLLLVNWVCNCADIFAKKDQLHFPENAVNFLNEMLLLFEIDDFRKAEIDIVTYNDGMEKIFILLKVLEVIKHLKRNFSVLIPLDNCLEGPVKLVSLILLEEQVNVDGSLMSYLLKYLIDNNFDPNNIFFHVIKKLLTYDQLCWIDKIYPIWCALSDAELKLEAILLIMDEAELPWSKNIHAIAEEALQLKHELVDKVKKKLKMEPIYKVLNNEEYKLSHIVPESAVMRLEAIQRIIYCNNTATEDVFALCETPKQKAKAAGLLLVSYARSRNMDAALTLINSLSFEETEICLNFFQTFLESELWLKFAELGTNEEFNNILKMLAEKVSNNSSDVKKFEAISEINKKFDMKITYKNLLTSKRKSELLEECLFQIVENIEGGRFNSSLVIKKCLTLAESLNFEVDEVLIRLCENCSNLDVLHTCLEYLRENSNDAKAVCQISMILLRHEFHDNNAITFLNDNSLLEETAEMPKPDINLYKTCLSLAQEILLKYPNNTISASIIFDWIKTSSMILNLSDYKIGAMSIGRSPIGGLELIRFFLNIFVGFLLDSNNVNYSSFCLSKQQEAINQCQLEEMLLRQLPNKFKNLTLTGNVLSLNEVIPVIRRTLIHLNKIKPEVFNMLNTVLLTNNAQLLEKGFTSKIINENLLFSSIQYFKYDKKLRMIKQALMVYKQEPGKFKSAASIGLKILHYHGVTNVPFCRDILLKLEWWKNSYEKTITYKDFFLLKNDQVLEKLINNSQFSILQIQNFCATFQLNVNNHYTLYLNQLLINGSQDYTIKYNSKNKKYVVMKNNDDDLFKKCMDVIKLIDNKVHLLEFINSCTINPYHYERLICALNIISALGGPTDNVRRCFLQFLISYTRVSKPGATERGLWFSTFPNTHVIDPLSEWRLPYTQLLFTQDVWNILNTEITLETYLQWFPVLHILPNLKKEDICSYAIKEIVKSDMSKNKNNEEWVLHSRYTYLFEKVDSCLQNISNLERASSTAYHLMESTPKGADQVIAAELCKKYALEYKNAQIQENPNVLNAYNKVLNKYHSYSATQILYINNLALPQYLKLVAQPMELIDALYSDERINKDYGPSRMKCPDINKAVDELGKLYGINIIEKQMEILNNYLSNSCSIKINLDESSCLMPMSNLISSEMEETNFKRASYVCLSENRDHWRNFLFQKGFDQESHYVRYGYKARALKCLVAAASVKEIEILVEPLHSSYQEFLDYVDKLFLLYYLQCYGMNISVEELTKYNKKKLLRTFAKDLNNPVALKVMMSVCFTFNITDVIYWEIIIKKLIEIKSVNDLRKCIYFLRKEPILYSEFYIEAWKTVLDHSLQILLNNSDKEDFDNYSVQHILSIQSCPVLLQMNLKPTFNEYVLLERYDLAAVLVQYFSEDEVLNSLNILLSKTAKDRLISSIQKLLDFGIVGTGKVMHLLDSQN